MPLSGYWVNYPSGSGNLKLPVSSSIDSQRGPSQYFLWCASLFACVLKATEGLVRNDHYVLWPLLYCQLNWNMMCRTLVTVICLLNSAMEQKYLPSPQYGSILPKIICPWADWWIKDCSRCHFVWRWQWLNRYIWLIGYIASLLQNDLFAQSQTSWSGRGIHPISGKGNCTFFILFAIR